MNRSLIALFPAVIAFLALGALWQLRVSPTERPVPTQPTLASFSQKYTVGFEGVYTDITYSLTYPTDTFIVRNDDSDTTLVLLDNLKTGTRSSIKLFWNGAAGIESPQQYWDDLKPCPSCNMPEQNASSTDITITSDAHVLTYANTTDEWMIEKRAPDLFIVTHFPKPTEDARAVWSTFRMIASPSASKTMPPSAE